MYITTNIICPVKTNDTAITSGNLAYFIFIAHYGAPAMSLT